MLEVHGSQGRAGSSPAEGTAVSALSSVGQSASLTSKMSGVRLPQRAPRNWQKVLFMSMETGPEDINSKEKEVSKFVYRDNFSDGKIIFECESDGIINADELYKKATGNDPKKQSHVGCSIEKIEK